MKKKYQNKVRTVGILWFSIFMLMAMGINHAGAQTISAHADSWVGEAEPDVNHNTETDMHVSLDTDGSNSRETYIKFDISGITDYVTDAKLIVRTSQKTDDGWTGIDDFYAQVYGNYDDSWLETEITWNTKPEAKTTMLSEINVSQEGGFLTFSGKTFTDYVNSAVLNGDRDSITFIIKGKTETPGSRIWISDQGWEVAKLDLSTVPVSNAIEVTHDTWVGEQEPAVNHNEETDMNVTHISGDSREAYVQFDLSGVSGLVTNASLSLRGAPKGDDGWTEIDTFYVEVHGTDADWAEDTLIWSTKPAAKTPALDEKNINASTWWTFSNDAVANYINALLEDGKSTVTFIIKGKEETPGSRVWFSDKSWAKPILEMVTMEIDDEIIVLDDSWVDEANPATNHDTETDMQIMNDTVGGNTKMTYIKFPLAGINGYIADATLQLKGDQKEDETYTRIDDFYVEVFGCKDKAWKEGEITWENKPDSNTWPLGEININYSGWHFISTDELVNYLNEVVTDGRDTVTFIIKGKNETPGSRVWISDKGWAKPTLNVSVVPTDMDIQVTSDTWVDEANPDANYEGETDMQVMKDAAGGNSKEAYIKFDISSITAPLHTAVLKLKGDQKVDETYTAREEFVIEILGVDDDTWDEGAMTWNNKPESGTTSLGMANIIFSGWHSITSDALTQFVNDAISNGDDSVSFVITGLEETPGSRVWISDKGWADPVLSVGLEATEPPADPIIAVGTGVYSGTIEVQINTATEGANIFYTIDGSEPTNSSSKYESPLMIDEDVTLKAIAYIGNISSVGTDMASYQILPMHQKLGAIEDGWISEANPDENYDEETDMQVMMDVSGGNSKEALLKFDLSGIDGYVANASLHLKGDQKVDDTYSGVDSFMIEVYEVKVNSDYDWDETTVTWNTKPVVGEFLAEEDVETGGYHIFSSEKLAEYVSAKAHDDDISEISFLIKAKHDNPDSRVWISDKGWAKAMLSLTIMQEGQQIEVAEDTWVEEANSFNNHDRETDMHVKMDPANTDSREIYLKFDISNASEATMISLGLKGAQQLDAPWEYSENFNVGIYGCTDSTWAEVGLLWANKPDVTTDLLSSVHIDSFSFWHQFATPELTDFINTQIAEGKGSVTFVVKGLDETTDSRVWISSQEWAAPKLTFYYGGSADIGLPEFDPAPGIFAPPSVDVTLTSSTEDASIYYTLDGSIPTEASDLYTGPVTLTEEMGLVEMVAVAVKDGDRSYLSSGTYIIANQKPYTGEPWPAPGRVEAWQFDLGGPGISHYEADDNLGECNEHPSLSEVRADNAMIDGCCPDGECGVGWSVAEEWLEYTVSAAEQGCFTIIVSYGKPTDDLESPGYLKIDLTDENNDVITNVVDSVMMEENVEDWSDPGETKIVAQGVELQQGENILRFTWQGNAWNFDYFELHSASCTQGIHDPANSFGVIKTYPSPVRDNMTIELNAKESGNITISMVDMLGRVVLDTNREITAGDNTFDVDVSTYTEGMYFLKISKGFESLVSKVLVK